MAVRTRSRRRRPIGVPVDGHLILLAADHALDPRTGDAVDRRELLDRLIEALSVAGVDGVVAPADILEELTLLNVLERRLAVCASGNPCGVDAKVLVENNFDAGWVSDCSGDPARMRQIRDDVADLHQHELPALVDISLGTTVEDEYSAAWSDWVDPIRTASSAIATGAGVWFTLPATPALGQIAGLSGFPIMLRDTEVPVDPDTWVAYFANALPMNVRGFIAGPSALFPIGMSVAQATGELVGAIRTG